MYTYLLDSYIFTGFVIYQVTENNFTFLRNNYKTFKKHAYIHTCIHTYAHLYLFIRIIKINKLKFRRQC